MDFTLSIYKKLLTSLQTQGYVFYPFETVLTLKEYLEKFVILRHDVDDKVKKSLATAQIEQKLGIRSTYYFRIVPQSNQPEVIRLISDLGHEIGYHYEDLTLTAGDTQKGMESFKKNLAYFRQFYPVKTVCMHGSPRSSFDSKDLWSVYNYRELGILGEPYFDIDFSNLFYLTDTGRRWDGFKVSVRDKIPVHQERWITEGLVYHSTEDILSALKEGTFPHQLMITTHPQRWTDNKIAWTKELLMQTAKNAVKGALIRSRKSGK